MPWWRVVRDDGSLNEKFPAWPKLQKSRLEKEGHKIEKIKGKLRIKNFEKFLVR